MANKAADVFMRNKVFTVKSEGKELSEPPFSGGAAAAGGGGGETDPGPQDSLRGLSPSSSAPYVCI